MSLFRATSFPVVAFAAAVGTPSNDFAYAQYLPKSASQMALDECLAKPLLIQGLTKEGQQILVAADAKKVAAGGYVYEKNIFTSNASLNIGYHFILNSKNEYCKAANIKSIRVLNGLSEVADRNAYVKPASNAAPGTLNYVINQGVRLAHAVPMLQASVPANNLSQSLTLTIIGNAKDSNGEGILVVSTSSGELLGSTELRQPVYSDVAKNLINRNELTLPPALKK